MSHAEPGTRPDGWWRFDSGRPDLADGRSDTHAHLRMFGPTVEEVSVDLTTNNHLLEQARRKLRHLRDAGELSATEVAEIHKKAAASSRDDRWTWRSQVLRETTLDDHYPRERSNNR